MKLAQFLGTVTTATARTSMPYKLAMFCSQYRQLSEQVHTLRPGHALVQFPALHACLFQNLVHLGTRYRHMLEAATK
jgi:hypothetical protein